MKIEFTNDSMTEARITRGVWRWKRQALVAWSEREEIWFYVNNGTRVEGAFEGFGYDHAGLQLKIKRAKDRVLNHRDEERARLRRAELNALKVEKPAWERVRALPAALPMAKVLT